MNSSRFLEPNTFFSPTILKPDASEGRPTQTDVCIGKLEDTLITLFSPESRMKYNSELSSEPPIVTEPTCSYRLASRPRGSGESLDHRNTRKDVHLYPIQGVSRLYGYKTGPTENNETIRSGSQTSVRSTAPALNVNVTEKSNVAIAIHQIFVQPYGTSFILRWKLVV